MAINLGVPSTQQSGGVINLSKGARVNLSKSAPALKKVLIGLGWDTNKYSGSADFDLDASVFCQNQNGRTEADGFVFYNNLSAYGGAVQHMGDNRTGEGDGDDEQIVIDLAAIPAHIQKIAVTITIDAAEQRGQNFGMVENSFCRLVDAETDREIARFDLGEDYSVETAVVVGELYKHNGAWTFKAVGQGFSNGLLGLCRNYGLDAAYN